VHQALLGTAADLRQIEPRVVPESDRACRKGRYHSSCAKRYPVDRTLELRHAGQVN
jgi:hypothetical protein